MEDRVSENKVESDQGRHPMFNSGLHMHTYINTHVYTYICAQMHTHLHTCTHMCAHTHTKRGWLCSVLSTKILKNERIFLTCYDKSRIRLVSLEIYFKFII